MALFEPGHPPTPGGGRPKGSKSGRQALLDLFDKMLAEALDKEDLRRRLREDIESKLSKNPVSFLIRVGFPLIPKELLLKHTGDEKSPLRLIFEQAAGAVKAAEEEGSASGDIQAESEKHNR